MSIKKYSSSFKLPSEYENIELDDSISQVDHNNHISKFKNQYFNAEAHLESLKVDINNLHENISKIQSKHHSDYIQTFNQFMETATFDLKEKIIKMDKIQEEREKDENILKVIAERNLFREESIRLNLFCKALTEQNDKLKREFKEKEDDYNSVYKKWRTCESYNQQLIKELSSSIEMNEKLVEKIESEGNMKNMSFMTNSDEGLKSNYNKNSKNNRIDNDGKSYKFITGLDMKSNKNIKKKYDNQEITEMNDNKTKENEEYLIENESFDSFKRRCLSIVTRLKQELKREKHKFQKTFLEMSRYALEHKNLEKLFIQCIEQVQNEIKHRKELELLSLKQTDNSKKLRVDDFFHGIGLESLLTQDKKKIIIKFFLSDDVINLVHDNLFLPNNSLYSNFSASTLNASNFTNDNLANEELKRRTVFQKKNDFLVSHVKFDKPHPSGVSYSVSSKFKKKSLGYINS